MTKQEPEWEIPQIHGRRLPKMVKDLIRHSQASLLERVEAKVKPMKKEYSWCDDGFDPEVPYGKHLDECERHYRMAIEDVLAELDKLKEEV